MPQQDFLEIDEVGGLIGAALDGARQAGWDDRALARATLATAIAIFQENGRNDLAASLTRWILDVDDFGFTLSHGPKS